MKKLFKSIVSVLAVCLLVASLNLTAFAANGSATISASGAVAAGGEVSFTVSIKNATGVKGIAIQPTFSSGEFQLVSGSWLVSGLMSDFSVSGGDGVIAFSEPTNLNKAVLKFTLKAKPDVTAKSSTVGCSISLEDTAGKSSLSASTTVKFACKHDFSVKDASAKFLKSKATCQSPAIYFYSCSLCGEKGTKTFESGAKANHTYDKKNTASKFAKTPVTCTEKGIYYYSCECGAKDTKTFEVAAGHSFKSKWDSNLEGHRHLCSRCGEVKDEAPHTAGPAATTEKAQVCTVCNYVITPPLGHTHSFEGDYTITDEGHSRGCECGATEEVAPHTFGEGVLQGEGENAVMAYSCTVCGFEKTEPADADLSDGADTDAPSGSDAVYVTLTIILGLLALSGWGLAIYLLLANKKKK